MGDKSRVQPAFWPIFNQSKLREHKEALKYPMRKDTWRKLHHRMKSVVHLLTKTAPKWKYATEDVQELDDNVSEMSYNAMISELKNHPLVAQTNVARAGDPQWTELSKMEIQSDDLDGEKGWYYWMKPVGSVEEHGQEARAVGPMSYATMMHQLCSNVGVWTSGQTKVFKPFREV